jgi:hypothetical protein
MLLEEFKKESNMIVKSSDDDYKAIIDKVIQRPDTIIWTVKSEDSNILIHYICFEE